eukprot:8946043-Karenia_brevis.AAC.1
MTSRVLVLPELNHLKLWRDCNFQFYDSTVYDANASFGMPHGHRLYIQAWAVCLVSFLLRHPSCTLVLTSGIPWKDPAMTAWKESAMLRTLRGLY